MLCETIMKRNVQCVSAADSVHVAAVTMRDCNVGFIPICDSMGKVVGTLTDRDITLRVTAENRDPLATICAAVMTREVIACSPEDDIAAAERLMERNKKSRVLCIDDTGELVGVISLSDIAERDEKNAARTLRNVSAREN